MCWNFTDSWTFIVIYAAYYAFLHKKTCEKELKISFLIINYLKFILNLISVLNDFKLKKKHLI